MYSPKCCPTTVEAHCEECSARPGYGLQSIFTEDNRRLSDTAVDILSHLTQEQGGEQQQMFSRDSLGMHHPFTPSLAPYSLTHSLTHFHAQSLTHSLTRFFACSLTPYSSTHSPTHSLTCLLALFHTITICLLTIRVAVLTSSLAHSCMCSVSIRP